MTEGCTLQCGNMRGAAFFLQTVKNYRLFILYWIQKTGKPRVRQLDREGRRKNSSNGKFLPSIRAIIKP